MSSSMPRSEVGFPSGRDGCRAWLYMPARQREPIACIVMAHGLGGTRDAGLEPYAEKFRRAGHAVLLFDYRHFGASGGEPRQLFSWHRQLADWASATAYARRIPGVNPQRIALWGTSFSGGHVLVAAARDAAIAAVSAQCPMVDGLAGALNYARYAGLGAFMRLGLLGMLDHARAALGLGSVRIPLIAPPGELAAMSSKDAMTGYRAIVPPDWRNEVCARYALTVGAYRPVRYARRVRCPVLIQVCMRDSLAPPGAALRAANALGERAQLQQFDCEHFDIYVGERFERASDAQLAFFNRVLAKGRSGHE